MDVREKLVELIEQSGACFDCFPVAGYEKDEIENIASHLVANGVTVQEWISVKDRLPGHGKIALVFDIYGNVYGMQRDSNAKAWVGSRFTYGDDMVTHWMPLPDAPKPPKGE